MKNILLGICLFCALSAFSQDSKLNVQIGSGAAFLGSGDIFAGVLEGEANYKLNRFLTSSFGIHSAYGYENYEYFAYEYKRRATYVQSNLNVLLSPFGNDKTVDFKIGTGVSFNNVWDKRRDIIYGTNVFILLSSHTYRNSLGVNMIMETTFKLNDKLLLGLKGFIQPYYNGDINSGVLLKFGMVI